MTAAAGTVTSAARSSPSHGSGRFVVTMIAMIAILWTRWTRSAADTPPVDLQALLTASWTSAHWLSAALLYLLKFIPSPAIEQVFYELLIPVAVAPLFGFLYQSMRDHGWSRLMAGGMLVALGVHPFLVYAPMVQLFSLLVLVPCVPLITAVGRLATVGDVKTEINMGLVLPLLLLSAPETAPLVLPLAVISTLFNPDARVDLRAFVAMFFVTLVPTLIVIAGIWAFAAHHNVPAQALIVPYASIFSNPSPIGVGQVWKALAALLPMAAVAILYGALSPGLRKLPAALMAALLPSYLVIGTSLFHWQIPLWISLTAMLVCFTAWAADAGLRPGMRVVALSTMAGMTGLSWTILTLSGATQRLFH